MPQRRSPEESGPDSPPAYKKSPISDVEFAAELVHSKFEALPEFDGEQWLGQHRRKISVLVLATLVVAISGWSFLFREQEPQVVGYAEIKRMLGARDVRTWLVEGGAITIDRSDGARFTATIPVAEAQSLWPALIGSGAPMNVSKREIDWRPWLWTLAGIAAVLTAVETIMGRNRRKPEASTSALGLRVARPRLGRESTQTLADFIGDDAREAMKVVAEFLKDPSKCEKSGAPLPCCHLLVGPPGCGKSLLARAVAGEANVPLFSISGSEFVDVYPGVGAARVRDVFRQANRHARSILFIDELDSIGRRRSVCPDPLAFEQELALSQLLTELDEHGQGYGWMVVIAATNRPDLLDEALLRPGRFGHVIELGLPSSADIHKLVALHARGLPLANDVSLTRIAELITTTIIDATGATVAKVMGDAAREAATLGEGIIEMRVFEHNIAIQQWAGSAAGQWRAQKERQATGVAT